MGDTGLDARLEAKLRTRLVPDPAVTERTGRHLAAFREAFGADMLASIDGETLLRRMHGRQGGDAGKCMAYWLEFKNDDEFEGSVFGSIAGGNAAKFGIYQRQADGAWVIGWPGDGSVVRVADAISKARKQRDELLAGHAALSRLDPLDTSDAAYARLQQQMASAGPELHSAGWAHKWWFLAHPDRLDSYHAPRLQRFHLLRLLQVPPGNEGTLVGSDAPRFNCAGRFVALARTFGVDMPVLTAALNTHHDVFHRYWRVGTRDSATDESQWPAMQDGGFVSIGWKDQVPDMSDAVRLNPKEAKAWIRAKLDQSGLYAHHATTGTATAKSGELLNFAQTMAEKDVVLACDGQTVLGIGQVGDGYEYDGAWAFPHQRPVKWLTTEPWQLPQMEGLRTSCVEIGKHAENLLMVERHLLDREMIPPRRTSDGYVAPRLAKHVAEIEQVLERKGQVLLYGPPGTGKTHWAKEAARELAARHAFSRAYVDLTDAERDIINGPGGLVRLCTFHPGYGYEDFMEGLRPEAGSAGHLRFSPRDGIFKQLCSDARTRTDRLFFLIVDEFNRGDVPRIFGELLTVIELDKRGMTVLLPLTNERFSVPPNIRLIGTMNTADRSISLLDAALRRRFGFIEMMPDSTVLKGHTVGDLPLGAWLDALNKRLRLHLKRDARDLQVGHAYLLPHQPITSVAELGRVLRYDLVPLLQEYCYDDFATLHSILGKAFVDVEKGRIKDELFEETASGKLIAALQFPELAEQILAAQLDPADEESTPDG